MSAELFDRISELQLALSHAVEVASELEVMLGDWPLLRAIISSMKTDLEANLDLAKLIELGVSSGEEETVGRHSVALPEPPEEEPLEEMQEV